MDVYSAESAVRRIKTFVDSVKESDHVTYEKTKVRYRMLAETLEELAHDFRLLSSSSVVPADDSKIFDHNEHRNLSDLRRQTVKQYSDVLLGVYDKAVNSTDLSVVLNLIRDWWNYRINVPQESTKFRYNIKNFPKWISSIVCSYGNSVSHQSENSYIADFKDWCSTVSDHSYPLPIEAQRFLNNEEPVSLTSVVLWDMAYDTSLKYLSRLPCFEAQLTDDLVFNLAETRSPQNLDEYVSYQEDSSIIQRVLLK